MSIVIKNGIVLETPGKGGTCFEVQTLETNWPMFHPFLYHRLAVGLWQVHLSLSFPICRLHEVLVFTS